MDIEFFSVPGYLVLILAIVRPAGRGVRSLQTFSSAVIFASLSASFLGGGFT